MTTSTQPVWIQGLTDTLRQALGQPDAALPLLIRKLRKRMGLSRVRFGRLLEVDGMTVYTWERGLHGPDRWASEVGLPGLLAHLQATRVAGGTPAPQSPGL